MTKPKVYIASPYTKGDCAVNVKVQLDMYDELMTKGYAPFAPLYSHFQHMSNPRPYKDWIEIDLIWVEVCDCVLRLPGESSGADGEVAHAQKLGKLIFYSLKELEAHYFPERNEAYCMNFELSEEQTAKYEAWHKTLKRVDYGAAGGGYSFIFTPTGLGDIIKVRRDDGEELDLTEIEKW